MEIETQCLYAGYSPKNGEPQTLPICQSTTFKYESTEQVSKLFDLEEAGFFYTRLGNPTVDAVEQKIATLEGGVGALCTASGQAATTFSILTLAAACLIAKSRSLPLLPFLVPIFAIIEVVGSTL